MNTKKILVPLALTEGSLSSVMVAARLAEELSATLVLLHVVKEDTAFARENALSALRQLATRSGYEDKIECLVAAGGVVDAIVHQAQELPAVAIVIASHNCRKWYRWLHHCTAREILRRASRPVWVIGPGPHGEPAMLSQHEGAVAGRRRSILQLAFTPLRAVMGRSASQAIANFSQQPGDRASSF